MNYEEISEHIFTELEYSLEELESLENREQLERQGIDVQNDIERYSALIDSLKVIFQKAKAWDIGKEAVHDHLQHLLHNTDTSKIKFGFVDGMYCTLDILEETYEKELSSND